MAPFQVEVRYLNPIGTTGQPPSYTIGAHVQDFTGGSASAEADAYIAALLSTGFHLAGSSWYRIDSITKIDNVSKK